MGRTAEHGAMLQVGAVLMAFSDGLIERHGAHFDDRVALLTAVVDSACEEAG